MFAFAIWNRRTKELLLARDRYGIKPLYYVQLGDTLLFASEVKAFLKHPRFRARLSLPHLVEYFTFQNIFTDGSFFDGVRLLPPGHWMRIGPGRSAPELHQYWDFNFDEADDGLSERGVGRAAAQPVRGRGRTPACQRCPGGRIPEWRSRFERHHGTRCPTNSVSQHLHRRLRSDKCVRSRNGVRRTSEGRGSLLPVPNRALRGRAESGRHGALPHRPRVAPRGPARRTELPQLLRRAVGEQIRQGCPLGAGGDELFGGYPWRYFVGVPERHEDYVSQYFESWNRLVPSESARELFRPTLERNPRMDSHHSTRSARSSRPRNRAGDRGRAMSTTLSTSRRRRSSTACSSSRTSSAWRTAWRPVCRS